MRKSLRFPIGTVRGRAVVALLVVAAVAAIGGSSARAGNTLNVCPGCTYTTIRAALAVANSGDTIQVAAGDYSSDGAIPVTRDVTLLGAQAGTAGNSHSGAESTVVGFAVTNANVTIDGFKIAPGTGNSGAGIIVNGGTAETVQNNVLTGYQSEGMAFYGTSNLLFQHNFLTSPTLTTPAPPNGPAQDGIYAGSGVSNGAQILNNVFDHASSFPGTDIGLSYTSGTNPLVRGNASTGGATFVTLFNSTGGQVDGNTFTGDPNLTGSTIYVGGGDANTTVSNNTVSGGFGAVALRNVYGDGVNTATTITGNTLTGNSYGIDVGSGSIAGTETVVAHQNTISANTSANVRNLSTGSLDATSNWWGTTAGPGTVSGVTTRPWCTSSSCTSSSDDPSLLSLSLSSGSLSPSFGSQITSYTASVDNGTSSVTVGQTAIPGAGVVVAGGSSLAVGENAVTVTVTSTDGTASRVYTVTVTRAAAAATTTAATTTTAAATTTTAAATTTAQPTEAATVVNQPKSVVAQPGAAGTVSVTVGPVNTAPGATTVASVPVSVGLSWSPAAFAEPVTVTLTPQPQPAVPAGTTAPAPTPVAGGFTVGDTVVQVNVTNAAGVAVTQFAAPLVIHISSLPRGQAPAYSHDGKTWTFIPQLSSPVLPATQQDGYFVNPDGSIDIETRHATLFGLLVDAQAPSRPVVSARIVGAKLYLLVRASDNLRVVSYRLVVNGKLVKRTAHAYLVLTARAGRFQVAAVDAAGNVGKPSAVVTVVRTGTSGHRFHLKG